MVNRAPQDNFRAGKLVLGTWALGGGNDWGITEETDAQNTLACALENGITVFDTAPVYGAGLAEERLGRALRARRSQVQIATKCGIVLREGRPDHDLRAQSVIHQCEESLRRLQTDYIDIYQIHWPDAKVPLAESVSALQRLKEQGKIRAIGVCNLNVLQLQEVCKLVKISVLQMPFSLLNNKQADVLATAGELGVPVWAYGVLGGGILSGKYTQMPNLRRCDARRYFYPYYFQEGFTRALQVAARVKKLAAQKAVPPAALALAWALHEPGVDSVLFGARKPEQVKENLQARDLILTSQEKDFLQYVKSN